LEGPVLLSGSDASGRPSARRVSIEVEEGSFRIHPGERTGAIVVEARYDEKAYALEMQEVAENHVSINFHRTMGLLQSLARLRGGHTVENRVDIYLPRGVPMELAIRASKGESEIDLGGLGVRSLDLDCSMGEHRVAFSEPNPEPLETMLVRAKMGEFRLRGIGHAGPRSLDVECMMGDHLLDFSGELPAPSRAVVRMRMGEMQLRVPADTDARIAPVSVLLGEFDSDRLSVESTDPELDVAPPAELELRVHVLMGEVRLRQ
jgi:hypothetical protein